MHADTILPHGVHSHMNLVVSNPGLIINLLIDEVLFCNTIRLFLIHSFEFMAVDRFYTPG